MKEAAIPNLESLTVELKKEDFSGETYARLKEVTKLMGKELDEVDAIIDPAVETLLKSM
jgi:hypothetical protein